MECGRDSSRWVRCRGGMGCCGISISYVDASQFLFHFPLGLDRPFLSVSCHLVVCLMTIKAVSGGR